MNEIRLVGNIVKDPEVFDTKTGKMARVRIAVNHRSQEVEETLYMDVKLFGRAYSDVEYFSLAKGDRVSVVGRLVSREYKNKDGVDMKENVVHAYNILKIAKGQSKPAESPSTNSSYDDVAF